MKKILLVLITVGIVTSLIGCSTSDLETTIADLETDITDLETEQSSFVADLETTIADLETTIADLDLDLVALQEELDSLNLQQAQFDILEEDVLIDSERAGVQIHATVVTPVAPSWINVPLVVFTHGHGGTKDENGGFTLLANVLASYGIASIRMDYPGCGSSDESWIFNTLSNMIDDTYSSLNYMIDNYSIDSSKVGIIGYSLGGRVVADMLTEAEPFDFSAVAMLAPATDLGQTLIERVIGSENFDTYYQTATDNGYVEHVAFGNTQLLSLEWFDELLAGGSPLEDITNFEGDMLVEIGTNELPIRIEAAEALYNAVLDSANSVELVWIDGSGHDYGNYNSLIVQQDAMTEMLVFFVKAFSE